MMHGPDLEGRGGGDNARYFSRLAARKDIYLGDYVGSVKMWVRKCRAGAWSEKRKRRLLKMGNLFKYAIDSEWRIHSEYKSSRSADLTFRDHQRSEVYHIMQFPKCMHHFGRCELNTQTTHRRIELYATNYCKYRNDQKKNRKNVESNKKLWLSSIYPIDHCNHGKCIQWTQQVQSKGKLGTYQFMQGFLPDTDFFGSGSWYIARCLVQEK